MSRKPLHFRAFFLTLARPTQENTPVLIGRIFSETSRRTIALVLSLSLALPSLAVAQQLPAPGASTPPGPAAVPPSPSAPPLVPADSFLLRYGCVRPDACVGVGRVALPPDYRLGAGDLIDVQLSSRLEVNKLQVIVDPEGSISLPPAGPLNVNGATVLEAQQRVNQELRRLFRFTGAVLSLSTPRCFEVIITGEVERPGATMASAMRRVHEVIVLSGGVTPRGSVRFVELFPPSGPRRTIDLLRFELNGDLAQNPLVEPGLRIHVPPRSGYVPLSGAVRRAGTDEPSRAGGLVLATQGDVALMAGDVLSPGR